MKQKRNIAPKEYESDLSKYVRLFQRRWHILALTVLPGVLLALAITPRLQPSYRATAQLLIEKEKDSGARQENQSVDVDTADEGYYQTQYKLIRKKSLARQVYDGLRLGGVAEFSRPDADPLDLFLEHVTVEPVRGSRLVNVSVDAGSPGLAMKIANGLADAFVRQNIENRLHGSNEILRKLPGGAGAARLTDKEIIDALPAVVNNQLIQSLKSELVKWEIEHSDLSQRYRGKHPALIIAEARVKYLREQIEKETRNAVESVRMELAGSFKANNVRVTEYAMEPRVPFRPDPVKNLILAISLSLFLGFGIIYYLENMDMSIREGKDVEQYLDIPFLGVVPRAGKKRGEQVMVSAAHRDVAEAIRIVRTSIKFANPQHRPKTLLFTSCAPGAGKTFVSLNTAAAFGQEGARVLLVDTDLRRATLTKHMKVEERQGLSDYLVEGRPLAELVQETGMENVRFLAAGTRSPNPAEVLASEKMKSFVRESREAYDLVVFDSAPVLPVSDTLNIAALMDGVVYVVYCGKLNRRILRQGTKRLEEVGARITGAVLNNVNVKARGYDYGYHAYGNYY